MRWAYATAVLATAVALTVMGTQAVDATDDDGQCSSWGDAEYFPEIKDIVYKGPNSRDPFTYR
eukprot:212170-Pyramimonas_sp.AAC.1